MNITFMIGNGFDLHLGMKTRFIDMYDGYIKSASKDDVIRNFKKHLKEQGGNGYERWSDFEIAMANHVETFKSEDDFIKCVRDFKVYMAGQLKLEQELFKTHALILDKNDIYKEMIRSITTFYRHNTPNVTNEIDSLKEARPGTQYAFVVFNYTEIVDFLANTANCSFPRPIHIHGSLSGNDTVLGVDNIEQFSRLPFKTSKKIMRAFVKPAFNQEYDAKRVANAVSFIKNSNVICAYGMSLGKSDLTWTKEIREWLINDQGHHLFYYGRQNTEDGTLWAKDQLMDAEEERKEVVMNKLDLNGDLFENQVHIPLVANIFDYKNLIQQKKDCAMSDEKKEELLNRLNALSAAAL